MTPDSVLVHPEDRARLYTAAPDFLRDLPEVLYHYTSRAGLLGIVSDRAANGSSIRRLNDSAEYLYALEVFERVLLRRSAEDPSLGPLWAELARFRESGDWNIQAFVFSLSEEGDSLALWRAYTRPGSAYAIGLRPALLLPPLAREGWLLGRCRYEPTEQEKLVDTLIDGALKQFRRREGKVATETNAKGSAVWFGVAMIEAAALIKHPAFAEEREWRLVRSGSKDRILFRDGGSMLVPYIKAPILAGADVSAFGRVVVGPSPHADLEVRAVIGLFDNAGIELPAVGRTQAPYRNW